MLARMQNNSVLSEFIDHTSNGWCGVIQRSRVQFAASLIPAVWRECCADFVIADNERRPIDDEFWRAPCALVGVVGVEVFLGGLQ